MKRQMDNDEHRTAADDELNDNINYINDNIFVTVFYDEYNDYHAPAKCHCGRYNPCRHHNARLEGN